MDGPGRQLKVPQINTISEIESIITDRKRSLGQGNIFAPVCHSVHRVGSTWAGTPRAGTPPQQCMLGYGTDGITNRCSSFYMSLCASCFAVPLVAVRLNYKFVTKSYVFTDHFNQSNFHFCDNTNSFIYFRYFILMPYIS